MGYMRWWDMILGECACIQDRRTDRRRTQRLGGRNRYPKMSGRMCANATINSRPNINPTYVRGRL